MGSATPEQEPDLAPGTIVGDYRIDHTIGIGGMAAVYQATQPVIGKRVAIKVLHRTKSETALNRFIKEARAVNLIGHPNIVDVFGFGMTSNGRAYLVMELLVGETLAVRIKRGPISVAETCDILVEVTHALEAAHDAGVIHRDLKPENVFLSARKGVATVKLLDFGIAKLIGDGGEPGRIEDTRPGVLIGTPRYISPEQVRGTALDGGADIYTLGVVAFELLAGRAPFSSSAGAYELFEKHAKLKPPKPSAFNPQLPEAADVLIGAMLAKEPGDRPTLAAIRDTLKQLRDAPASELAAAREAAAAEPTDVHARPAQVDVRAMTAVDTPTMPVQLVEPDTAPRWRLRAAIGAAGVAALVIALVIATTGGKLPARVGTGAPAPAAAAVAPAPPPPVRAPPIAAQHVAPPKPTIQAAARPHAVADAPAVGDEPAIEIDPVDPVDPATTAEHVSSHAPHSHRAGKPASAHASAEKPAPEKPMPAVDGRDVRPAGSAADGRRGSVDGRDVRPTGSAADGRRGSDDDAVRSPFEPAP